MIDLFRNDNLLEEDLYKFKETLEYFHNLNVRGILKKNNISNDINSYKTLPQLWAAIKNLINTDDESNLSNTEIEKLVKSKEAEKVWETDNCYVYKVFTHRAACYYGKGTRWCTASKDDDTYFKQYSQQGPLFIIIDKIDTDNKYQFHMQSESFADQDDRMLDSGEIMGVLEYYELSNDFVEKVLVESKLVKPDNMVLEFDDLTYIKRDRWYLRFEEWSAFFEYLPNVGANNTMSIFTHKKEDITYPVIHAALYDSPKSLESWYDVNIDIDDIDSNIIIDNKVFDYTLGILESKYPETYEFIEFQKKLKEIKNLEFIKIVQVIEILNYFPPENKDIINIKNAYIKAYRTIKMIAIQEYIKKLYIDEIFKVFNFAEEPTWLWSGDRCWEVPINNFDITEIFAYALSDDYYDKKIYLNLNYDHISEFNLKLNYTDINKEIIYNLKELYNK